MYCSFPLFLSGGDRKGGIPEDFVLLAVALRAPADVDAPPLMAVSRYSSDSDSVSVGNINPPPIEDETKLLADFSLRWSLGVAPFSPLPQISGGEILLDFLCFVLVSSCARNGLTSSSGVKGGGVVVAPTCPSRLNAVTKASKPLRNAAI